MVRYHLGPGSTGRAAAGQAIAAAPAWCWAACVALLAAGQAQTWSWKAPWNSKKWGLKLLKMISGWIVGKFVGKKIWNDVGFEYPRDLISIFLRSEYGDFWVPCWSSVALGWSFFCSETRHFGHSYFDPWLFTYYYANLVEQISNNYNIIYSIHTILDSRSNQLQWTYQLCWCVMVVCWFCTPTGAECSNLQCHRQRWCLLWLQADPAMFVSVGCAEWDYSVYRIYRLYSV